jgi:hypothetical protein
MNSRFRTFALPIIILILTTACSMQTVLTEKKATPDRAPYKGLIGRSLTDEKVADFVATNNCAAITPYVLCKETGMALLIDSNQQIEGVFLYVNKSAGFVPFEDDFTPYNGELPLGLKFYDTMGAVEYKLSKQGIGDHGLPDSASTPDHMHYTAFYKEAGLTIIYNSPQDEDALIHAILVRK